MTRTTEPNTQRPRVILVNGNPGYFNSGATWKTIVDCAKRSSRENPNADVAICRLGDLRSLRRFVAGVEVTR